MRHYYLLVLLLLALCLGCQWGMKSSEESSHDERVKIERYDRIETLFLTTGDYSALQQMNTDYSLQTRTLIENVLQLGNVDERDINSRFFGFYQDTTLQAIISEVQHQYEDMDDVTKELATAFESLKHLLPDVRIPHVYTQITALDQSIVVGDGLLGISLDKYLGADYPLYQRYGYSDRQRQMMSREFIVPDCISFYLLSLYPSSDVHSQIPKIQYVVNQVMGRTIFDDEQVSQVGTFMNAHRGMTIDSLLKICTQNTKLDSITNGSS